MGGSMRSIAVLGSLNADLVIQMDRYPNPGETVVAKSFAQFSGGKGANQAVACGRLEATVSMFGAVGKDIFASKLLQSLEESNVKYHDLCHCEDTSTGMAHIWVDAKGENSIAIVAGANARVDKGYIEAVLPKLKEFSWLLLQLEVPMDSMSYLLDKLPSETPKVILDPAPAKPLAQLPTRRLWLITPNEHELQSLTGISTVDTVSIQKACRVLIEKTGTQAVLCKAGSRGAYLDDGDRFQHFPGYAVRMVDSTAAGDAFNGTLAVALSKHKSLQEAIGIANAAGALCVTRPGAQQSMPWRKDLDIFLNTQCPKEQEIA
jgi:ribokinase